MASITYGHAFSWERRNLSIVGKNGRIPEFAPHAWLRNGHAMTIAAVYWPRRFALPKAEARLFRVAEDSQLLAACHWQEGKGKDGPGIAVVDRLEGSFDLDYVLGVSGQAYQPVFLLVPLN